MTDLGSTDKWDRYAGYEFGGIWLDEASQYQAVLHELLENLGWSNRSAL
ncbi:hypothetical protein C491_17539 [Natronococcus amylolyticus DSM 10524]|uniref:Uncharacterized protein n=1 Tax=Natronococcus amylolyticus DSM 10524 TaxID=1227497 RepID=L9X2V1_9EURY|nr:hypothetical protein [Natronococcus amylolyticus]ELY54923.1 hypothetical protein C491_17539 [Natronococcus amylolyticus DSM 10524]